MFVVYVAKPILVLEIIRGEHSIRTANLSNGKTETNVATNIWTKWGLRFVAKYDYKLKKLVLK